MVKDIDSPATFSPDGKQFAYIGGLAGDTNIVEVHLANADGNFNRVLAAIPAFLPDQNYGPAWSPDGKTIVV